MRDTVQHSWDVTYKEAVAIQQRLAKRVVGHTPARLKKKLNFGAHAASFGSAEARSKLEGACGVQCPDMLVGAADISYNRGSSTLFAAVLVLRLSDFAVLERVGHRMTVPFPYIPGLLSFREVPTIMEAFRQLKQRPDILLCDGQGFAHPRRFGLACHLGVLLGLPTIGCAKTRLIGEYREPGLRRGAMTQLRYKGEVLGRVLRTRAGVKPIYVSIGHQIDLDDAVKLVLKCSPRYRIPEPVRQAHLTVNHIRENLT